ncbi:MAG TPA: serine hydrolase domain-containing protein [Tahibacter sp.]|nr:serine hydrolase domain-containing protein [Tahibacter sp.]
MTLAERMAFHQIPAVGIAVIDQGRVAWARAYGVLDTTGKRPATTATLFQAASISKAISALGALRLVEQGKLSLDAGANTQLTAWKLPDNAFTKARAVTLRMLLNHSAGVTVHGYHGYAIGQPVPTLLQVLDGTPPANSDPVRVDVAPGTVWRYSGGGFSVIQLMMAEASQQPFDRYMQTAVLDPLGMTDSTFAQALPPQWRERAATAHDGEGRALAGRFHVYPESAAAGLWTTPSDLARVVIDVQQAHAGKSNKILSRDMTATMLTRGLGEYGLGFFVEKLKDTTSFSHSGGNDGFKTQLYGYTQIGKGVVVMTNGDNGAALIDEVMVSVAAEYGWPEFQVVEKTAIAADAAVNASVAGDYRLAGKPAHVVAEGDRLYFQSELFGAKRMELFLESRHAFFMTAQDMSVRFEQGGNGEIAGFSLVRGSNTYPATRTK